MTFWNVNIPTITAKCATKSNWNYFTMCSICARNVYILTGIERLIWSPLMRFAVCITFCFAQSLCIVTTKSTLINYRDCRNGYRMNWMGKGTFFNMLEYTEILQPNARNFFLFFVEFNLSSTSYSPILNSSVTETWITLWWAIEKTFRQMWFDEHIYLHTHTNT